MPTEREVADDSMSQMWPDAEQRAARRAKLHTRLDDFLDSFVEADGGWALAEDTDVSALREIVSEIADLKFQRDGDGDSVINFHMVNRRRGRLISEFVPYQPRDRDGGEPVTPQDILEYIRDSIHAARYLISSGDEVMRGLDYNFKDVAAALPPVVRLADAEPALIATFGPDLTWKDAMSAVSKFQEVYSDAREAHDRVIEAYLVVYGDTPEFVAADEEIIAAVNDGHLEDARQILIAHRKTYGFGIRRGIQAFNELGRKVSQEKLASARRRRAITTDGSAPVWSNPVYEAADNARNAHLATVDANDEMGALAAAVDAALAASKAVA